ncbi:hypothetical protein E4O93_03595 [Diaphorobacter sp. DS2]|nr:hypothetical protein E4O93_03595 [Diaphorobacter sp. DS2]
MDGLVLSGVGGIVLSGVRLSCYQEYESPANPITARFFGPSNFPNLKHLTDSRSAARRWKTANRHEAQQQQPGFPAWRARP